RRSHSSTTSTFAPTVGTLPGSRRCSTESPVAPLRVSMTRQSPTRPVSPAWPPPMGYNTVRSSSTALSCTATTVAWHAFAYGSSRKRSSAISSGPDPEFLVERDDQRDDEDDERARGEEGEGGV